MTDKKKILAKLFFSTLYLSAFTFGGVGSKPMAAKAGKDVSAFKEGVKVSHPKFGTGLIVKVTGIQGNTILHVAFEGFGIKLLSASLAPLKIL